MAGRGKVGRFLAMPRRFTSIFLGLLLSTTGWSEVLGPKLEVGPVPPGKLDPFRRHFTKYINVFGIHHFATTATPDAKLVHAATVTAEYLDNNEDGSPDNAAVTEALAGRDACLVMANTERELDRLNPEDWHRAGFHAEIAQWAEETNPGGGKFDATLEEVLHLITQHGYANAYPRIFSERPGTKLGDCLDAARGGRFLKVPRKYPKDAWFTYDDRSCDYGCMATEYIYWALTSMLGAHDTPERRREIEHEWRLWSRELVKTRDPAIFKLLTDPKYNFPKVLPDGAYRVKGKKK